MAHRTDAAADQRRLLQIDDQLNRVDLRNPGLDGVLKACRSLLRAEVVSAYNYQFDLDQLDIGWTESDCGSLNVAALDRTIRRFVRGSPIPWVGFNHLRPEPWQRNQAVNLATLQRASPERLTRFTEGFLPAAGMGGFDQLRVIVFEDGITTGWFGGYRLEPFTRREVRLVNRLVPSLQRRLRWRRLIQQEITVERLLEAIPSVAFVIDRRGTPVHANSMARARWNADRRGTAESLRQTAQRGSGGHGYDVAPITQPGEGRLYLATLGRPSNREGLCQAAAQRWGLTPRQKEVLDQAVAGKSNLAIALELGCAVKTVETHLAALFEKAQVGGRSELVAKALGAI